jgi:aminoglycoside phosphotransferase (APT) family kinase protein
VAAGSLFPGSDDEWPFLVMERLDGLAWRDANLDFQTAESIARHLGSQIRHLHQSAAIDLHLGREDWIAAHGQQAAERHQTWGSLPKHLIDQIPTYLGSYDAQRRCLVHGDLTEDHLFVKEGALLGIIDWGDAMVTDPFYELGALHLGAFAGDRRLLSQFLRGYRWRLDEAFVDHALQVALMHEFDLFGPISTLTEHSSTLTALAKQLWTPIP